MATIFALSTPPGKSGVAIIRVSGEAAFASLSAFGLTSLPNPRMATTATLYMPHNKGEEKQQLDQGLVLTFPAPHSFTGEDVVEYQIHGSQAVIKAMLEGLSALPGCRLAEPGEFTRRAFLNGKIDLTAAEGLADLIDAQTQAQHKQAMRFMQGDAARFYEHLRGGIIHALAYLEAYIDFPDEDIPEHVTQEIRDEVQNILNLIMTQLADKAVGEKIRDGIRVVILGAPNVGKSSLMNLLAGRDVAIVSSIAGTTRDVIEIEFDLKGYRIILSDTAGIRDHADIIEQEGIRRAYVQANQADIRIIMLDVENTQEADEFIKPFVEDAITIPSILVVNKADLLNGKVTATPGEKKLLSISVKTKSGIDQLLHVLESHVTGLIPAEASFITRSRHRTHLIQANSHLDAFLAGKLPIELSAEELRRAATEIGKITGHISVEELLGHIFSSFCIGK